MRQIPSDDSFPDSRPPDDEPDQTRRNNGKGDSKNGRHSNDPEPSVEQDDKGQGDLPDLPGLGLPDEWAFEVIPTLSDLQRAALHALHREISFLLLHQDEPEKIAERLDEMADIARAASQVAGPHQAKAIRLGLELRLEYWLARNKLDDWVDLIMPLLKTALEIKDRELQSLIYRAWGIFLFYAQQHPGADNALEAALDYADEAGWDDLKLLARAERFNLNVLSLPLDEAQFQAEALIADARHLKYALVQGRAYYSLARAYQKASSPAEIFMYAQQALAIFIPEKAIALAGQCVAYMLGGLSYQPDHSPSYLSDLLAYLEALAQRSVDPLFQAMACYGQGCDFYYRQDYDRAREYIIGAWWNYRAIRFRSYLFVVRHMLGLVQMMRHQWPVAERHLRAAYAHYAETGDTMQAVHAQHALAYIPVEQGDLRRGLGALKAALRVAEDLPPQPGREHLLKVIQDDCADVEKQLRDSGPA
jgi:hypothetical protein